MGSGGGTPGVGRKQERFVYKSRNRTQMQHVAQKRGAHVARASFLRRDHLMKRASA